MNHLSSTLVLCDLDHLLLGADGNLTQVVRDVLQLFVRLSLIHISEPTRP